MQRKKEKAPASVKRDQAKDRFIRAWIRLFTVLHRYNAYLLRRYGLSGVQLGALRQLELFGPLSLGDLAKLYPGYPSGISQLVDRLVEHGWIARERSAEDRRRVILSLTEKAKKVLSQEPPLGPPRVLREMDRMGARESESMAAAMECVVDAMIGGRESEITGGQELPELPGEFTQSEEKKE